MIKNAYNSGLWATINMALTLALWRLGFPNTSVKCEKGTKTACIITLHIM